MSDLCCSFELVIDADLTSGPARSAGPASAAEALYYLDQALVYLAGVNPAELTGAEQADCLRALEVARSRHTAAHAALLSAFAALGGGMEADGQCSPRTWMTWQTRVTRQTASTAVMWMRRLAVHPVIAAALAEGWLSSSWARQLCDWSESLPECERAQADKILVSAADSGLDLADLARLAEEMHRRLAEVDTDQKDFEDRRLELVTHFRGAGKLDGDLTGRCAEALQTVLDSLGKKVGPEDTRTPGQRRHDALEEMCLRLMTSGGLPDRAGQPARLMLHMTLPDLLGQPARSSHDFAGLGAVAAPGDDCDAVIVPIVTGHVDLEVLTARALQPTRGDRVAAHLALDRAIRLLSGPDGIAATLRAGLGFRPAAGISLPLDIGAATETVPAHLRRAVTLRDQHCRFPGCDQPPAACDVHHIIHREDGGPTSLSNLVMLCRFHHLIAIHRWGWKFVLNPDGTTTATSPSTDRVLHSHAPPNAA
jgi:hypothetical protein